MMGLFGGSKSTTTSQTDSRAVADYSVLDTGGGSSVRLNGVYDSDITLTDQGAVDASYAAIDNAISTIRQQSSEALQAASRATSDSIKAVVAGNKGDTQAVLGEFAKWGTLAVLGLAVAWAVVNKG